MSVRHGFSFDDAIFRPGITAMLGRTRPTAGERVLDVACGSGIPARQLGSTAGHITSLDIGRNILKKARAGYGGGAPAHWVRGDAAALPFVDGSFDLVLCHQGLQFVADPAAALGEMTRVAAPRGRLALMVWAGIDQSPCYAALARAVGHVLGDAAAAFVKAPFVLGDRRLLERTCADTPGTVEIDAVDVAVEIPDVAAFARAFLRYLPAALMAGVDPAGAAAGVVERTRAHLAGAPQPRGTMAAWIVRVRCGDR
jgi:SAM-dependent methyltransferase